MCYDLHVILQTLPRNNLDKLLDHTVLYVWCQHYC